MRKCNEKLNITNQEKSLKNFLNYLCFINKLLIYIKILKLKYLK